MNDLPYAIKERLRLMDFLLDHYGTFNRKALTMYYGISTVQASKDIQAYLSLAPANAEYDKSAKTYRRTPAFARVWP
jgi:hypothetical protein